MKNALIALAASILAAGCISTDLGPQTAAAPDNAGVNAERSTGSNLSRRERDRNVSVSGREELERLRRPGGSSDVKGGGR
jgi:outer membrane receptor protein involved in Fe transport